MTRARNEDWARIVQQMLTDTATGALKWDDEPAKRAEPPLPVEATGGAVYSTRFRGRKFRLYRYSTQTIGTWNSLWRSTILPSDGVVLEQAPPPTTSAVTLELVSGAATWTVPRTEAHWELFEEVRRQVSGADEFVEQFLAEKGKEVKEGS